MPSEPKRLPSLFTPQERDLIRLEMGMRFGHVDPGLGALRDQPQANQIRSGLV
jgi:hypothetical protein